MRNSIETKKYEKDLSDSQGLRYELRWVKHPRYEHHYKRIAHHVREYFKAIPIIIVDIGCGTGRGSLFFADFGDTIVGLDISKELLKIFKEKIRARTNTIFDVELILCDAENLPFQGSFADLVTFWGTLHHLPDKEKALTEATFLLKECGILTLHEPNRESSRLPWILGRLLNLPQHVFRKLKRVDTGETEPKVPDISSYERPLTLSGAMTFIKKRNLRIIENRTVWFFGIIPLQLPWNICNIYYFLANSFDSLIEKHLRNRAGAVFIVARKSCDIMSKKIKVR